MLRRTSFLVILFSLAGGLLLAQVPAEERIPITDPDRLERMGFSRNAKNVFVWLKADLGGDPGKEAAGVESAETWGSAVGYTTLMGYELQGSQEYLDHVGRTLTGTYLIGFNGCIADWAYAQIHLPDGASLALFRFWAYDVNQNNDLTFRVYETCQAYGLADPVTTMIAENSTLGAIGNYAGAKALGGLTVNNRDCGYTAAAYFDGFVTLQVRKLQFLWTRQVSPAPATATFNDVPTSHPFFRFVEALKKAGITGGCGGGNYCPNDPITRGQMAVFLSTALGLQWP